MNEQQEAFSRALEKTKAGDYAAALSEFVWLHDNPNLGDPSSEMFRRANGFLAWATLGTMYPPAADKMRELLGAKMALLELSPDNTFVGADARAMSAAIATYDSL